MTGRFDAIVSIEMLEATGEEYWPAYFGKLKSCLAPGGTAVLQVITIAQSRYADYRRRPDFIQRYIFPGGVLPTVGIIEAQSAAAGLKLQSAELFGESYALTLAAWRERFLRARASVGASQAEAERFRRMWEYYLAYCEAGFRLKALDVGLYRITRLNQASLVTRLALDWRIEIAQEMLKPRQRERHVGEVALVGSPPIADLLRGWRKQRQKHRAERGALAAHGLDIGRRDGDIVCEQQARQLGDLFFAGNKAARSAGRCRWLGHVHAMRE